MKRGPRRVRSPLLARRSFADPSRSRTPAAPRPATRSSPRCSSVRRPQDGRRPRPPPVTTTSSEAQAFYDQGLTFLHHYVFIEAARSFHQALRSDPECAMCWMGLARAEQGLERREATAAAIEKAQTLGAKASKKEQTFIALRAKQIDAQAAPSSEEHDKHAALKSALDTALAPYPDDAELWIMRGNAEEPGPWGRGQFGGAASIAFYETALVRSPRASRRAPLSRPLLREHRPPRRGRRPRKDLRRVEPRRRARPAHVRPRPAAPRTLGRGARPVRKGGRDRGGLREGRDPRPGDDWHHLHNLQLLGYTYLRLRRVADAEKTFRRAFETPARLSYRGTPQASLAELSLLRGRPRDSLAVARALQIDPRTPATHVVATVVEGEALLALGQVDEAEAAARRAEARLAPPAASSASSRAISTSSSRPIWTSSTPRSPCAGRTRRPPRPRSGGSPTTYRGSRASTPGARGCSVSTASRPTRGAPARTSSPTTSRPR